MRQGRGCTRRREPGGQAAHRAKVRRREPGGPAADHFALPQRDRTMERGVVASVPRDRATGRGVGARGNCSGVMAVGRDVPIAPPG